MILNGLIMYTSLSIDILLSEKQIFKMLEHGNPGVSKNKLLTGYHVILLVSTCY